jgi:hypothetical protein
MKKIIKYSSYFNFYENMFIPAKNNIPEWYKNTKNDYIVESTKNPRAFLNKDNKNFKMCVPFLDSFLTGYLVSCPVDILVSHDDLGNPTLNWNIDERFVDYRENQSATIPTPPGCHTHNFVWVFPLAFKLPEGYSALITHPLNRYDLPFVTISGIVDDNYAMGYGNYPFFVKENFNGIIKKGTPIAQIIPFKRESWSSKYDMSVSQEAELNNRKSGTVFSGWYKNTIWKKKEYE